MNRDGTAFLVRGIRIPYTEPMESACKKAEKKLALALGRYNTPHIVSSQIFKTSVDARKKQDIAYVCTVLVTARCKEEAAIASIAKNQDISVFEEAPLLIPTGSTTMEGRPVIVGFGPAGMFCALLLAENGVPCTIIERGDDVEDRIASVARFYESKQLDTQSNIQFGAGGAGTFSDGKLMTRIGDPKCAYILRRFTEFGADPDILIKAKPHVGTDVLTSVVSNVRDRLISLGCDIHFRTTMTGISYRDTADGRRKAYAVVTDRGEIPCGALFLALGHSARDTHTALYESGMTVLPKPFSVGVRIEHLQSKMNEAAYGRAAANTAACGATGKDILLPPMEYAVSMRDQPKVGESVNDVRGVYSFCMCPGGEVMAAASEESGVVVNGMSRSKRDGRNANAALAVSVKTSDYGNTPMGAIAYQRALEKAAFTLGGGSYAAPCQTVGDLLSGKKGTLPKGVTPSYMQGNVTMCDLTEILPDFVSRLLCEGIRFFDRQISGFADPDAVLTGVETRTSSPVRLLRGDTFTADGCANIYPIGEGAGYAGGITSAAADGLNAALAFLSVYKA